MSESSQRLIPVEDVARHPRPGMSLPVAFRFSPDGSMLTYRASPEGGLAHVLFGVDVATGTSRIIARPPVAADEDDLSLEEQLRRERLRQRAVGITSYAWEPGGSRVLLPIAGGIFVLDEPGTSPRELVSADSGTCLNAVFSPDGASVMFVRDAEVYVVPTAGGDATQITSGARGTGRTNGLAEYVAEEEMARYAGAWWSPDSSMIAFEEADETHIPEFRIMHSGKAAVGDGAQEDHRYPFAGDANAKVRLGVVAASGGDVTWMDLGDDEDIYLARVHWFADGSLAAQIMDRRQQMLRFVRFDLSTGEATELLRETSEIWLNLHHCFRSLKKGEEVLHGGFLWASERTGFRHLELRARDGSLVRVLTEGDWMVDSVARVDETARIVYFMGTKDGATECNLYSVSFDGGDVRRLTSAAGMHHAVMSAEGTLFVDVHHSVSQPPRAALRRTEDLAEMHVLHESDDARIVDWGLEPPELLQISTRDGVALDAALYRPAGDGPFPIAVSVYGGPHAQRVKNGWDLTVDLRAQALARRGFVVLVVDNRGAARRGLAFEAPIRWNMGDVEVQDQVDGVRWLAAQGIGDASRVGIYGWSYGGYMSLMCLARAPDVFHAAVAGAPVTAWDGYDTCYTERYMGLPQENADGYANSEVMAHVDGMVGKLLLVHGMIDENVHFRHTARLVNAMNKARKPYDLLMFPDERHMPRGEADRVYMEERIMAFLEDALK